MPPKKATICSKCSIPLTDANKYRKRSMCKECNRIDVREKYQENRIFFLKRNSEYRLKNKDKFRSYSQKHKLIKSLGDANINSDMLNYCMKWVETQYKFDCYCNMKTLLIELPDIFNLLGGKLVEDNRSAGRQLSEMWLYVNGIYKNNKKI